MRKPKHNFAALIPMIILLLICGCNTGNEKGDGGSLKYSKPRVKRDLPQIRKEGVLHAITIFSPTSYFLYRGQPMGFEYELLQRLAEHMDLKLDIIVAEDMDNMLSMLNQGKGDLIAYGMTITKPRKEIVSFTHHHFESHQVLVQRKPENWRKMKLHEIEEDLINDPLGLIGKTIHVRKNSSYYPRLKNLSQEIGGEINIIPIAGTVTTDELIKMVAEGEIDYTVADNNIAALNKTYYPILDVNTAISFSQRMAWAVRKNSPQLLDTINDWIDRMRGETDYFVIYNKYFKNKKLFKKRIRSDFHSETAGKISEYDDLVQSYADLLGWDWRLVSALIYQESKFDPNATSWAGGMGLMQLMPATAKEVGVKKRTDPEESIRGGVRYLKEIWGRWDGIDDSIQRIKFTLASYNCGYQHVVDAQKLAAKYGDRPDEWDDHVEEYLLLLSDPEYYREDVVGYGYVRGIEPYEYVREIFERYTHYKRFIPREVGPGQS